MCLAAQCQLAGLLLSVTPASASRGPRRSGWNAPQLSLTLGQRGQQLGAVDGRIWRPIQASISASSQVAAVPPMLI